MHKFAVFLDQIKLAEEAGLPLACYLRTITFHKIYQNEVGPDNQAELPQDSRLIQIMILHFRVEVNYS